MKRKRQKITSKSNVYDVKLCIENTVDKKIIQNQIREIEGERERARGRKS